MGAYLIVGITAEYTIVDSFEKLLTESEAVYVRLLLKVLLTTIMDFVYLTIERKYFRRNLYERRNKMPARRLSH